MGKEKMSKPEAIQDSVESNEVREIDRKALTERFKEIEDQRKEKVKEILSITREMEGAEDLPGNMLDRISTLLSFEWSRSREHELVEDVWINDPQLFMKERLGDMVMKTGTWDYLSFGGVGGEGVDDIKDLRKKWFYDIRGEAVDKKVILDR